METKYYIPKNTEVSKWEYDAFVENMKIYSVPYPSWLETLISQAIGSL